MFEANVFNYFVPLVFVIAVPVMSLNLDDGGTSTTITSPPTTIPPSTIDGLEEVTTSDYFDEDYMEGTSPPPPEYDCEGKVCVKKCCQEGFLYDYENFCVKIDDYKVTDWTPDFKTKLGEKLFIIRQMVEQKDDNHVCLIHSPKDFTLQEDGTIHYIPLNQYFTHDFYCIDNMHNNGTLFVGGALCYEDVGKSEFTKSADKLLLAGLCISCVFLTLLLLVHCIASPWKKDLQNKCTISSCISLLFGFLLTVINMSTPVLQMLSPDQCVALGVSSQFFLLSFYFWLNIMCYDISRFIRGTLSMKSHRDMTKSEKRYFVYCAYSWGAPLFICMVTITLQYLPEFSSEVEQYIIRPGLNDGRCWFKEESGAVYAYYYGLEITLHIINTMFMGHTAFLINKDKFTCLPCNQNGVFTELRTHNSTNYVAMFKQQLMIYMMYIFIWILNAVTLISPQIKISRVTDVIVSLQGVFLFLIVIAPKKNSLMRQAYEKVSDLVKEISSRTSTKKVIKVPTESSASNNDESPL